MKRNGLAIFLLAPLLAGCAPSESAASDASEEIHESVSYKARLVANPGRDAAYLNVEGLPEEAAEAIESERKVYPGDSVLVGLNKEGKTVATDLRKADLVDVTVRKRNQPGSDGAYYDLTSEELGSNYSVYTCDMPYALNLDFSLTPLSALKDDSKLYVSYLKSEITETVSGYYSVHPYTIMSFDPNNPQKTDERHDAIPESFPIGKKTYRKDSSLQELGVAERLGDLVAVVCNAEDYETVKMIYGTTPIIQDAENSISICDYENLLFVHEVKDTEKDCLIVKGMFGPWLVYSSAE